MTAALRPEPEPGQSTAPAASPRRARRPTRGRVWVARLFALPLAGLALPLLLFELVLRTFGPVLPGEYQLGVLIVPHDRYGHFHLANASTWYRSSEYSTHVQTNARGLRGPEIVAQRSPGRGRILVSGDSFVEGRQVSEGATLAALLGTLLDEAPARDADGFSAVSGCEVVNAGVAGWGTGEEYVYLRDEGLALHPDLVMLVVFLGNDVSNNARRADPDSGWHAGPGFRLEKGGRLAELNTTLTPSESTVSLLLGRLSFAYTFLESGVLAKLGDEEEESRSGILKRDLFATRESSPVRRAWALTEALIGAIAWEVTRAESSLLIVSAPASYQVYADEARWLRAEARSDRQTGTSGVEDALTAPNRRLAAIAERLGVWHLDLLPSLRRATRSAPRDRLYFEGDAHWTAAGHHVAAREVARFLGERPDLAPSGCRGPEGPPAATLAITS